MERRNQLINFLTSLGYKLIESDNYNLANRIKKYDKDLLLFFNPKYPRYEIHSCTFFPSNRPTYCISSEYLDSELLLKLKRADNRTEFGFREKMDLVEQSRLKEEISNQKKEQDLRENMMSNVKKEDKGIRHFYMGG